MSQYYSDPSREDYPYALPDVEVFYAAEGELQRCDCCDDEPSGEGWYWWTCFPGCLPDGAPEGPFATKAEAVRAMRDEYADAFPE